MLRVVAHKSAAAARQYYAEGLKREDYYSEGQEIIGKWHGKASAKLGLNGDVKPDQFAALVDNRHPVTGARLTPHTKKGRIVGYDLNFHAPKSLSVLYALTGDKELLKAFRKSVADTMEDIEKQIATRVRKGGAAENRTTGNFSYAEFVHFTARPVGGIPDPHLHVHCFTFNATFDDVEGQWKAAKFRGIKKDAPYSEAIFHSRLTSELAKLGYAIDRTRTGWEIKGMPPAVLAKFSRRTAQIERLAHEKGITDAKAKDALGATSRQGKRRGLTNTDLLAAWGVRLTADEKVTISKVHDKNQKAGAKIMAGEAIDFAAAKLFENNSVALKTRVLAEAMRYGVGHTTPESIRAEFDRRGMVVRQIGEDTLCTSLDVLAEEVALIKFVRSGRGTHAPLGTAGYKPPAFFSAEQKMAMRHVLESNDQVIGIRGAAGAGKTTVMKEVAGAIEANGRKIFAFAPSASASRETLRELGITNADTIARLLIDPKLQEKVRGQVLWVDEAGMVGIRDMWRLMEIAGDTPIILTGDHKQHHSVQRGDPFRLLQQHAGLRVVEITILRFRPPPLIIITQA